MRFRKNPLLDTLKLAGEKSGDLSKVNLLVVRTDYMGSHKGTLLAGGDELRDVGHEARRYKEMAVASHLACLSRHQGRQVCDVISDEVTRYIKLQNEDQLRLDR